MMSTIPLRRRQEVLDLAELAHATTLTPEDTTWKTFGNSRPSEGALDAPESSSHISTTKDHSLNGGMEHTQEDELLALSASTLLSGFLAVLPRAASVRSNIRNPSKASSRASSAYSVSTMATTATIFVENTRPPPRYIRLPDDYLFPDYLQPSSTGFTGQVTEVESIADSDMVLPSDTICQDISFDPNVSMGWASRILAFSNKSELDRTTGNSNMLGDSSLLTRTNSLWSGLQRISLPSLGSNGHVEGDNSAQNRHNSEPAIHRSRTFLESLGFRRRDVS